MKRRMVGDVDFEEIKEKPRLYTGLGRAKANAGHYAPGQHCDSSVEASS